MRVTPSGAVIDDERCATDGCEEEATVIVSFRIGSFGLGPIEVPACDTHGAELVVAAERSG